MEKLDINTLNLLGKSFLEWGKSFKNLVEIFTPGGGNPLETPQGFPFSVEALQGGSPF